MKLRIKELSLRNFKGVTSFALTTTGDDVTVSGDNATGKTTIVDAWCWLLFGKDSNGRTDFEIKTLESNGEAKHGLEHSVSATIESIDVDQSTTRTFRKVYKEKWQKKRGSADKEFTGHTTDHFIDDVPMKKKEFDSEVAKIASGNIFRLLTDPIEFAERMKWQDRRELLLRVCGNISDEEVIALDSSLVDLSDILTTRSIDDHRKVVMARRKDINTELERIPIRIDEGTRALPPASLQDESTVMKMVDKDRKARKELTEKRARIKSGGEVAERTKELREAEASLLDITSRISEVENEGVLETNEKLQVLKSELTRTIAEVETIKTIITGLDNQIEDHDHAITKLRDDWNIENELQPLLKEDETTCSACGQKLPADRIERARQRVVEDFNERKALRLQEIDELGNRRREARAAIDKMIMRRGHELKALEEKTGELDRTILMIESEVDVAAPVDNDLTRVLQDQKDRCEATIMGLKASIANLRTSNEGELQEVDAQIIELDDAIALSESKLTKFDQARDIEERVDELKANERTLAAEYENLERELYLLDTFTRRKVKVLEDLINARFRLARFKMFNVLMNGGLEECCEVTFDGVPYSAGLNHGARIQVGMDVVRTLQDHFSFLPPVWVDQSESITSLPEMECQIIRLQVESGMTKLHVHQHKA